MSDTASNPSENAAKNDNSDVEAMTFEQAVEQLERIVGDLEKGDVPLGQSIDIYERGEALKKHCEKLLNAAENRIEKIRLDRSGAASGTQALDETENR